MLRLHTRRSAGDTLIEVVIAVAIISFVLVTAYTISNRSNNTLLDTQEHAQASRLAGMQVELLHANGDWDDTDQCFESSGVPSQGDGQTCAFTADGLNDCPTTNPYCYTVAITKTDDAPTYQVQVSWDSILGGQATVTMLYQLPVVAPSNGPPPPPDDPSDTSIGGFCSIHPDSCDGNGNGGASVKHAHYGFQGFIHTLTVGSSPVTQCTWDWGDGTHSTYAFGTAGCQIGGGSSHTYPQLPGLAEGDKCTATTKAKKYTVILYLEHQNGTRTPSNVTPIWRPNCY